MVETFEALHEERYGTREPGQYVEFTHWRVSASGLVPKLKVADHPFASDAASETPKGRRKAYFRQPGAFVDTDVYDGGQITPGNRIDGPAIVEEPGTTLVIPPNWRTSVTSRADYVLEVKTPRRQG
jgi:N-methylhydantoinase A